ncbi:hypothetical protein SLS55_009519 [Diplodia seriata]|uniref:Cytochrome p450 n=1 Tax=Diplodia seriata TaxID=420778 RepID=A0ABR3C2Y2_9PEZI
MSAKPEEIAPATGSVAGKSLYLISFTLLILIVVNRVKVWWRLRHFNGPWLASISSFPAAKYATSGKMWWHYTEVNKKYGDLARIGSNDLICSDPEVIRYMSSARSGWHRSDWYDSMSLDPYCNNVINTKDPVAHDKMRTKLVQGYAGKENPTLEADIDKQVASLVSLIKRKYIFSPASNPTYIDFGKAAQYFTLDVITALGFGFPFGYLERDEDVHEYVKTTETIIPVLVLSCCYPLMNKILGHPWVRAITGPHTEDKVGLGKLMGLAREVVGERFGPEAKDKRDMLGSFVRHGLPRREAESEVLLQLAAGSDTTATAVRATLLHLLTTPGALFKLREEIDAGIREGRISSPITNAEARELSYLQAVIKEGLRMQPPFIGLLAKEVPPQGEVIKGKFVPGGTKIGHSIYAAERSEEVFGKDADAFRPERWLEEPDEKKLRLMEDTQQLVFGYGRWGCLGKSIALVELNKVFVELTAPVVATSEFKLPIPTATESQAPPFQQSIRDSEKLFSAENELAGHNHTKAWAMCSSPMGDLVASGVSFHPGDMVEYTIAATSRTHIGVQPFHDTAGAFILPASGGLCPVEDLSAETLIYCAQTWLEELPEESRAEHSVRSTILEQFWRALGLSNEHDDGLIAQYPKVNVDGLNLEERTSLAQALRRAVYSNDKSILKQRYGRLLTLFFDPKGTTQSDDAPAIQKLVTEVLRVPRSSYNDSEASRKIRTVYSSMLPWLSDAEAGGMYDGAVETSTDKHVERCEICDDSIGFESFAWARCGQGHEFGEFTKEQGIFNLGSLRLMRVPAVRCSLTFLAIQAPGISKLCGICGKRYLNEESVVRTDKLAGADTSQQDVAMPDVDGGQQGDILPWAETNVTSEGSSKQGAGTGQGQATTVDCGRSPITLARMLFAACDVCIYCGGKFVG